MRQLYVYYRIDAARADEAAAAARATQSALRERHAGLEAALLRRPETRDGELTLMETYAAPHGVHAALQAEIESAATAALAPWLRGPRHTEVFETID